jgi:hypothetical protein
MADSNAHPRLIHSPRSGTVTKDGVAVEVCIYRLADTNWTLEVVDSEGTSTVWDGEFETDEAAYAEFQETIENGTLEFQVSASKSVN